MVGMGWGAEKPAMMLRQSIRMAGEMIVPAGSTGFGADGVSMDQAPADQMDPVLEQVDLGPVRGVLLCAVLGAAAWLLAAALVWALW